MLRSPPKPLFVSPLGEYRNERLAIRWRTVEWAGVFLALFIQSGGVFILAFSSDRVLDPTEHKLLQAIALPVYLITTVLLARRPMQFARALRRNVPLILMLFLVLLSTAWSISPTTTLRRAIALMMSLQLSFVLAIRFSPRQILVMTVTLLGTFMVLSLLAVILIPGLARMPDGGELRGVFIHKNVLGWYAAMGLLTCWAFLRQRELGLRPLVMLLFAASFLCLVLSESVTALATALSALIFAVFYIVLTGSRHATRAVVVLIALQLVVILVVSINDFLAPFLESTGKDASLTGRVPLWTLVRDAIAQRSILGYGYQAFWTEGSGWAWVIWTKLAWMAPHAHNGYLDSVLSFGIVGTALMAIMICRGIYLGAALQCREPEADWLWLNVLVCVFLVMNLTESVLLAQNNLLFILFMTAIIKFSLGSSKNGF